MSHFFLRIHAETQFFQLPIPKSLRCWGNELAKASAASSHTGWKRCFATQKLEFHDFLRNLVNAQDTRKAYRSLETSCLTSFWSIPRPQPLSGPCLRCGGPASVSGAMSSTWLSFQLQAFCIESYCQLGMCDDHLIFVHATWFFTNRSAVAERVSSFF